MIKIAKCQIFIFFFDLLKKRMGPSNMFVPSAVLIFAEICVSTSLFYIVTIRFCVNKIIYNLNSSLISRNQTIVVR